MGVETSAVTIKINVIDPSSGQVIQNVTGNLDKLGQAGTRAGQSVRKGMEEAGVGSLSAVEKMRLVTEEAGVRLPRAMIRLAAESKLAQAAVGAVGSALIGIGAIQIGTMIFTQLYQGAKKFYEEWLDIDGAIARYNQQAGEAATKKFDENRSVEQLNSDLRTANELLTQMNEKRLAMPSNAQIVATGMIPGQPVYQGMGFSMNDANAMNAAQGKVDEGRQAAAEKQHQRILEAIEDSHRLEEARVEGSRRARIEEESADQRAIEDQKYRLALAGQLADVGNRGKNPGDAGYLTVAPGAGQQELQDAEAHARVARQAAEIEQEGSAQNEIRRIHEQAEEAERTGIARLEYEHTVALADLVREHISSTDTIRDVDRRYYADEKKLADDAAKAIAKTYESMFKAAHEAHEKELRDQQEFADRVTQLASEAAMQGMGTISRIHAEAQQQKAQLLAEGKAKGASGSEIGLGIGMINQREAGQAADAMRSMGEQTEALESQARSRLLSSERNKTAAIENEYEERFRKFQEEKDKELAAQNLSLDEMAAIQSNYDRRMVAAGELRDAELLDSAREAREKMAGEFTSFFRSLDHPMEALKQLGDKAAGEAAAAIAQRMQEHFSGRDAGAGAPANGTLLGKLGGWIAGGPHGGSGTRSAAATEAGGLRSMAIATAQIFVQSASIGLGGGVGGGVPGGVRYSGGTYSGGSFSAGGATSGGSSLGIGGAGSAGYSGTAPGSSLSGSPGIAPPRGNVLAGAVNDVNQGMTLFQQGKSIFGGGGTSGGGASLGTQSASTSDDQIALQSMQNFDVNQMAKSPSGFGESMLGGGGFQANAGGVASGALGVYSAYEGTGGVGGALSGAMSGMQLGMALGGPIGAAIGAAGGAILGAIGMGGREKARVYDLKQVRPHMAEDEQGFETGSMDYLTAYADMQTLDTTAERTTKQWGPAAHSYYNDIIRTEIAQTKAKFTSMEKSGRSNYTASAAQYDLGTDAVPRTGMAVIHQGERIVPSDQNERITRAVENGADGTRMATAGSWGGDVHFHVHALDTKNARQAFMDHKHLLRAAVNESYAENSGGADAGY